MFEDENMKKKVFGDRFPYMMDMEPWADVNRDHFVNKHESGIFLSQNWPEGFKKHETEGRIKFERIRNYDCLFNSRFECGNLRQVFKVPQEHDYEWIELEPEVPDYLPEELQAEERQKNKEWLEKRAAIRRAKQEDREQEEEQEIRELMVRFEEMLEGKVNNDVEMAQALD